MELKNINENAQQAASQIASVAGSMWDKGWAEGSAGNISMNITSYFPGMAFDFRAFPMVALSRKYPGIAGNYIFISTRGSRMRILAEMPEDNLSLVKISEAGDAYQLLFEDKEKPGTPSSELLPHLAIHDLLAARGGSDKAILHTHPQELIALTHLPEFQDEETLNSMLWSMHTETVYFIPEGIGFVPFELPGSEEMAEATLKALENHHMVLWEKHGCLAIGKDPNEAFDLIDIMVKSARIYFTARTAGHDPEGLSKEEINRLRLL